MKPEKVNVKILHPTDSAETLDVAVSRAAMPPFLVDQLVKAGFVRPMPSSEGQWGLLDEASGAQLRAGTTLEQAGITDGRHLRVIPRLEGAAGVGA